MATESADSAPSPRQNRLLAALPSTDYDRLLIDLELVCLETGKVISAPGKTDYVQFPVTGIISLLSDTEDGRSAETAIVGRDGMVGFTVSMGRCSAVVQSAGYSYRLGTAVLEREFEHSGALRNLLLRYTLYLLAQTGQNAICNRYHSVLQQYCRAVLTRQDRSSATALTMTHELIANNLGVRREAVTAAAVFLRRAGLIDYRHGRLSVLDRAGLQTHACECYAVLTERARSLPPARRRATVTALSRSSRSNARGAPARSAPARSAPAGSELA